MGDTMEGYMRTISYNTPQQTLPSNPTNMGHNIHHSALSKSGAKHTPVSAPARNTGSRQNVVPNHPVPPDNAPVDRLDSPVPGGKSYGTPE